jgi:ABC-type amino acid transport system permease subunit
MDFSNLKEFQDNGGIVITILVVVFVIGVIIAITFAVIRATDWAKMRKELRHVARVASADVGQHEINYHEDELKYKATLERLIELRDRLAERIEEKKANPWTGTERRKTL